MNFFRKVFTSSRKYDRIKWQANEMKRVSIYGSLANLN